MNKPRTRCNRCEAPIQFQPGAGSRLCPFCGTVNLVREQQIAAPPLELKIDEVFRLFQSGQPTAALKSADHLRQSGHDNYRLAFYRGAILLDTAQTEDAIYALIDLSGMEAPSHQRADTQAKLAEALLVAGRTDEAIQAAERCLELVEGHPTGAHYLTRALITKKEVDKAFQIISQTIEQLDKPWKIAFPPQNCVLQLLKSKLAELQDQRPLAIETLEQILTTDTAAPLDAVATAGRMLGLNYLQISRGQESGQKILRLAALMDPENRRGLLDALRTAAEATSTDINEEIQLFKDTRAMLLSEIREALRRDDANSSTPPEMIKPELDLTLFNRDPDRRTDMLERAASVMQLTHFDRGTLYPLRTVEDFRRWAAAWRLRTEVQHIKRRQAEVNRILGIKAVVDSSNVPRPTPGRKPSSTIDHTDSPSGRRWIWRSLLASGAVLIIALLFILIAGNQYLDKFEGTLIKVECQGDGGKAPCSLHVAAGVSGRKRHHARVTAKGWFDKQLRNWLDGHIHADGTVVYPLDVTLFSLSEETYKGCVGHPIAKMKFTLSPICSGEKKSSSGR